MRLLILVALLLGTGWLILRSLAPSSRREAGGKGRGAGESRPLVQDPVCKTFIPKEKAVVLEHKGETVYFCSERCAELFREES